MRRIRNGAVAVLDGRDAAMRFDGRRSGGRLTDDAPLPLWLAIGGLSASAVFTTLAAGSTVELEMTALLTAAAASGGLGLFGLFERLLARRDLAARRRSGLGPALETAPEPVVCVDRYGRITALNSSARAAFASAGAAPRRAAELLDGVSDPGATVYRVMREALGGRPISERVSAPAPSGEGGRAATLDVWGDGDGGAIWRWRFDALEGIGLGGDGDAIAWCRIEPNGRVSEMSPLFARWLAGGPTDAARPIFEAIAPEAGRRFVAGRGPAPSNAPAAPPSAVSTRFVGGPAAPRTASMLIAPTADGAGALAIAAPGPGPEALEAPSIDRSGDVTDALEALDGAQLFDDAPIGVLVLSPDGRVLRLNGPADRLLTNDGASDRVSAGPLGDHLIDWLHADDREAAGARLRSAARGLAGGGPAFEARLANDCGESRVAECHFTRIDTTRGRLLLGFLIDASEQRELRRNFVQAQRLQAVGELAGGVAHDFNNLLLVISGYCETLLASLTEDDPAYGDLCLIHQSAERAKRLVKQLLAFSRRQTLTPTLANLSDEAGELTSMLNRLIGEKIELRQALADDVWPVRVDVGQFGQVLTNLVVNARDAMPEGGVITVRTANEPVDVEREGPTFSMPPGEYVRLDVGDTGCGIPKDKQAKIFQPFYTTKGVGEGTGLGLSMVYGIIKQTGGYIFVDSEVGDGTTFSIFLPRCMEAKRRALANGAEERHGRSDAELAAAPAPVAAPDVVRSAEQSRRRPSRRAIDEIGPRRSVVARGEAAPAEDRPAGSAEDPFAAASMLLAQSRAASGSTQPPPSAAAPAPSSREPSSRDLFPRAADGAADRTSDGAGSKTILLVEDETAVRALAARFLRSRGYDVLEAECGEDALEILEDDSRRIDLMLSDVIMPNMDGPSVLRRLGARRPELKTIFMSGYARDAFAEMFEAAAPAEEGQSDVDASESRDHLLKRRFGFLAKPFSLADLAETVGQAIENEAAAGRGDA